MSPYLYLTIAIVAEVIATSSLKAIKGLATPLPLSLAVAGYGISFWMLILVMRSLPVGIVYAIWSGLGIVLVSIVALFIYNQKLDPAGIIGMSMIIGGVVVINLFSKVSH
ncbi:DMT family transporter [Ventosimonas gracilis]|nr:multidrug efflux SMR transporter [Ventosimonas gracilis]